MADKNLENIIELRGHHLRCLAKVAKNGHFSELNSLDLQIIIYGLKNQINKYIIFRKILNNPEQKVRITNQPDAICRFCKLRAIQKDGFGYDPCVPENPNLTENSKAFNVFEKEEGKEKARERIARLNELYESDPDLFYANKGEFNLGGVYTSRQILDAINKGIYDKLK